MIDPAVARSIRLVGFDIDGVMTDGGIYLGAVNEDAPLEFKRYDIQDGVGIVLLQRVGIRTAIVTGRVSKSVRLRAKELRIDDVAQDPDAMKLPAFLEICGRHDIDPAHAAYIGDDFPDLPILRRVGLSVAVGNAVQEIKNECRVQLVEEGGRGAIREFCEMLLRARGEWETAWHGYVEERSHPPGAPTPGSIT